MTLTEAHIICEKNPLWQECDKICFASKNLYNQGLYRVLEYYKETGLYKNYHALSKEMSTENQVDFTGMKAKVSQQTLMILHNNMRSYFAAIKKYKTNPSAFKGCPQPPMYLHKTKGRFVATFTSQAISTKAFKEGIKLSGTEINVKTDKVARQVSVTKIENGAYKINIIYNVKDVELVVNKNYAGIDIGLNNLATVVTNKNDTTPFILNGKPLKAINQFYNKKLSLYKSELPFYIDKKGEKKQKSTSKKIKKLTHKRNCKVKHYMHEVSRVLAKRMKQANISKVVIGKNKQWKTGINIRSQNNQKFVSIPHAIFIDMVIYKLKLLGIETILREESYTSKCSFLDNEEIGKHEVYLGRRIKRGLFRTSTGFKWNADCNGACNILVKEIPDAFADGIEAVVVPPIRIKSYTKTA